KTHPEGALPAPIGDALSVRGLSGRVIVSTVSAAGGTANTAAGRALLNIEGLLSAITQPLAIQWPVLALGYTPEILAMSRQAMKPIKQFDIIKQLTEHSVKSVFCVQEAARSTAHCGRGLLGPYSYDQDRADAPRHQRVQPVLGRLHLPELLRMLDLVRVMQFALTEGRIAVHCHAGLGRTGLAIACLLVFSRRLSPALAIAYLRLKAARLGAVAGVREFSKRIRILLVQWPDRGLAACGHRFSYEEHLHRQRALLHGVAARKLRRLSLLVHTVCTRLLQLSLGADRFALVKRIGLAGRGQVRFVKESGCGADRFRFALRNRLRGAGQAAHPRGRPRAATSELAAAAAPPRLDDELKVWRDRLKLEGSYRPVLHCQDPGRLFRFLLCWLWELKAAAVTRQHAMDDLEEAVMLRLLSGLTQTGLAAWDGPCAANGRGYPAFAKYFRQLLGLHRRPGVGRSGPGGGALGGCGRAAGRGGELRAEEAREIAEKELPYGEAMALDGDAEERLGAEEYRAFD
uniref:TYR_PHOSPHATASE_2 domain-containing protein n=1 Tax=Macrostomum lignano TaxID=282301 RepID=A0A1I8FC69_9PLAT